MIFAGTGHRPDKLGGYTLDTFARLQRFAYQELQQRKPDEVISGMAQGWDMALADACYKLSIPYIAAVPFKGQEQQWRASDQAHYWDLLAHAKEVVYVNKPGYVSWKFQKRNEWMVDHCNSLLALWGGTSGGTANTLKYAQKIHKPVINVWKSWKALDPQN